MLANPSLSVPFRQCRHPELLAVSPEFHLVHFQLTEVTTLDPVSLY
jgi:hypothetical protein